MTDADYNHFQSVIDEWLVSNKYFVTKQNVWFSSRPWLHIKPGMTCDEVVKILAKLGW